VILRLAWRSLTTHPVRSGVLAFGFGVGVSVMATLLGVGEVILDQARAPALRGGGDLVILGATGPIASARYVLSSVLGTSPLKERMAAASPTTRTALYLVRDGRVVPVRARGGIPSRERALGDPETAGVAAWADAPGDAHWASPDPADVLRTLDRFHPIPDVPARAASWAEWLYFNGRAGDARFYLTYMVGPRHAGGRRMAGVRLQLERDGHLSSYSEAAEVDEAEVLARAPDLAIGRSRVRLEGLRYRLTVDLPGDHPARGARTRAVGELLLDAIPGRAVPPLAIRGASGWLSGYVVPVMSGTLGGALDAGGERVAFDGGTGYHDHNWGFWKDVTWQWGQVQHGGLSFVYGRVHPPPDAADPERIPGFLAALGPEGPIGYAAEVSIQETSDPDTRQPRRLLVKGHGPSLELSLDMEVQEAAVTRMPAGAFGGGMDFFQLRTRCHVTGKAGERRIDFEAPGSAETFRGK
jgi:hypothetical protein